MLECDVLVIGAGPAGSAAALAAAREGARVIMLERKKEVGTPVQCAEYIPFPLARQVGIEADAVAQSVNLMRTHLPDGQVTESSFRGIICHRDRFDRHLARLAGEAGAELMRGVKAAGYDGRVVSARRAGEALEILPGVLIGADGPSSTVRQWMGLAPNRFVQARQYSLPLSRRLDSTEIFFRRGIPGGYGWVFPKGETANVGIGVEMKLGTPPETAMKNFTRELLDGGVIAGIEPLSRTGGMIPVGGQSRLRRGNIILAGDAAGQCHPVTGAGVPNAFFAGGLAGEAAARAAATRDPEPLAEYEENCRLFLGDSLDLAVARRRALEPYWQGDARALSRALEKSWIAFEEYYEH